MEEMEMKRERWIVRQLALSGTKAVLLEETLLAGLHRATNCSYWLGRCFQILVSPTRVLMLVRLKHFPTSWRKMVCEPTGP